jgi:drug/metabolite transporter (DMT)-like permease
MNLGAVAAVLSATTWAIGSSAYARLAAHHSAPQINATRALAALPFLAVALLLQEGSLAGAEAALTTIESPRLLFLLASAFTSYLVGDALFFRSATLVGTPAALSIASAYPIWAALGGVILRGEPLRLDRMAGVAAVVTGTILVIAGTPAKASSPTSSSKPLGVVLAVATSFSWALNAVFAGLGTQGASVPAANLYRMIFALLGCAMVGIALGRRRAPPQATPARIFLPFSKAMLKRYGWVFVIEPFGGGMFFLYALSHTSLAVGTALASLAPLLAVPIALVSRTEAFSRVKFLGITLGVTGVMLLVS